MVDSLNIPNNLTKTIEVEVTDKSDLLKNFLTDLLLKIESLEARVEELENGS